MSEKPTQAEGPGGNVRATEPAHTTVYTPPPCEPPPPREPPPPWEELICLLFAPPRVKHLRSGTGPGGNRHLVRGVGP